MISALTLGSLLLPQFQGLSMRTASFNYQQMGHSSFPTKQHKQNIKEKSNLHIKKLPL
jgi:hypothetical protein